MIRLDVDLAVLGSGFGGALVALIASRIGLQPVLIDKQSHPRFAIGESSTPVANMVLRDLADRYEVPQLQPLSTYGTWQETYPHLVVGRKRGFSYFAHERGTPFAPDPQHANELLVTANRDNGHCDTHWLRADVDAFFANEVRKAGVTFWEDTEVTALRHDDPGWWLAGTRDGERIEIHASFVIDATGPARLVPRALGVKDECRQMRTCSRAIYTHFSDVVPWQEILRTRGGSIEDHPYSCDDAALHHVLDGAWMWILRFNDGRSSAGLVLDACRHPGESDVTPAEEWHRWVRRYPSLHEQFAEAQLVDPPGAFVRTGRLQRRMESVSGKDWALLPHAAGFVDPLHSTGIAHTLCGVERLAQAFQHQWGSVEFQRALERYERAVLNELAFVDELVAACYASMGQFRLWTASTMLYFAAATTYERRRSEHKVRHPSTRYAGQFLCADDRRLRQAVRQGLRRLARRRKGAAFAAEFEQYVEEAMEPFNTVGLFHPEVHNMYHHTAAPV